MMRTLILLVCGALLHESIHAQMPVLPGVLSPFGAVALRTLLTHIPAQSSGGGTVSTTAITTTGASLIVVLETSYGTLELTDSATGCNSPCNTFQATTPQGSSPNGIIYYVYSPHTGANHVFTSTAAYASIDVMVFSGTSGSAIDKQVGSTVTTAFGISAGSTGTLSQPAEIGVAALLCLNGGPSSPAAYSISGSGFTTVLDMEPYSAGNAAGLGSSYYITSSTTALNPAWSWTDTNSNACAINATFP